jgi:hypothetical protein
MYSAAPQSGLAHTAPDSKKAHAGVDRLMKSKKYTTIAAVSHPQAETGDQPCTSPTAIANAFKIHFEQGTTLDCDDAL